MKQRLEEIKKRFMNTTGGDWEVYETDEGTHIGTAQNHPQLRSPSPVVVMSTSLTEPRKKVFIKKEDAAFIAHSKSDIRFLLNLIDVLQREKAANNGHLNSKI